MRGTVWTLAILLGLGALALDRFWPATPALLVATGSAGVLVILCVVRVARHRRRGPVAGVVLAAALLAAALVLQQTRPNLPLRWSLATAGLGFQILLLSMRVPRFRLQSRWERARIPALGHAITAAGLALMFSGAAVPPTGRVTTMIGLSILFAEVVWTRREGLEEHREAPSWEAGMLVVLATFLVAGVAWMLTARARGDLGGAVDDVDRLLPFHALTGLAMLAGPPALSPRFRLRPGGVGEFWIDSVTFFVLIQTALVVAFLGAERASPVLFVLASLYLVFTVVLDHSMTLHALRHHRSTGTGPLVGPLPPITVVVAAKGEAQTLRASLEKNLKALPGLSFLVAVGGDSPGMYAMLRSYQDAGSRLTIVPTPGASKATDLSLAWRRVKTPLAFILDADETVDESSLRRAVGRMETAPRAGIIQGRKLSRQDTGWLGRFVLAERRFSTLLDHRFQSDVLGAAHFAGSAALVRRDVPGSIGGWHPTSLTEDIEFAVRLHRAGAWDIVYDPHVVVEEQVPLDFASLIRQRGRWARGWAEVCRDHLWGLLRDRDRMGWKRTAGLGHQLLTAVTAPWAVLLPLFALLWFLQHSPWPPAWLAIALAVFVLPGRPLAFAVAYLIDAEAPRDRRILHVAEAVLAAFGWIVLGWLLQLHALYLELSGAPRRWLRTRTDGPAAG